MIGVHVLLPRCGDQIATQRLGERRAAAEGEMTQQTLAARPFDLKLDGSILEGFEHRIDSGLITRPLCLKPLENFGINPERY